MVYCMSDIHGEYDRYMEMLQLINFSDADMLYVIGDVIDRKPGGVDILFDIMQRPNVKMILGNHEKMMLDTFWSSLDYDARRLWKGNGGGNTYRVMTFILSTEDRRRILQFIQELPEYLNIEVNGRKFHLVHGMPGDNMHDRIWGRPEPAPTEPPMPDSTVIVGHTCTYYLNGDDGQPFRIWHGNGIIGIDCGCGNSTDLRRLACLRLNDMKEFYV